MMYRELNVTTELSADEMKKVLGGGNAWTEYMANDLAANPDCQNLSQCAKEVSGYESLGHAFQINGTPANFLK